MNKARRQEIEAAVRYALGKTRQHTWATDAQIVADTLATFPEDEGVDEVRSMLDAGRTGRFEVFTVIERTGKSHWMQLGRGYLNKDSSINVFLDALPLNGKLQIRVEGAKGAKL